MLVAALKADAVTVTTPRLQAFMENLGHSAVYLLPNYLDDALWALQPPVVRDDGVVRVGYMGGDSHAPDIQMILPALQKMLQAYPSKVQLTFWGLKPPEALLSHPDVAWEPLSVPDYVQFADNFSQQDLDIFLAPLAESRFNQAKSPVKFLECTAIGGAGICSDIVPYQQVVEHGKTGYLADTVDAWFEHLKTLIENPRRRVQMVQQAQENIQRNWLLSAHYQEWTETYQRIIEQYRPRDTVDLYKAAEAIQTQWTAFYQMERENSQREILALKNQLASIQSGRAWKVAQFLRSLRGKFG